MLPPARAQVLAQRRRSVRVADYLSGADAAPAWLAAIRAAAMDGRSVDVSGKWVFYTPCDASGYPAFLVGRAQIDASAVAAPFALILGGREGQSAPLGADVERGGNALRCNLPLAGGDVVRLLSTEPWSTERPYYVKGELLRVLAADGNEVLVQGELHDDYLAALTQLTRLEARRVLVQDGIELIRNADSGGLLLQWAREPVLRHCFVFQARERGIYLRQCLGGQLVDCGSHADHVSGGKTNYGLALSSCAGLHIVGGNFRAGRHGLTSGGTFPCRDLTFTGVIVDCDDRSGSYSLDAHANGERLLYHNVTSLNGAVVQAIDSQFVGGHYGARSFLNALSLYPARSARYYTLHSVEIRNERAGGRGLTLSPALGGLTLEQFLLTGGRIDADIPFYCIPAASGSTRYGSIEFAGGFQLLSQRTGAKAGSLIGPNVADAEIGQLSFSDGRLVCNGGGAALTVRSRQKSITSVLISGCDIAQLSASPCVDISQAKEVELRANACRGYGLSSGLRVSGCDLVEASGNRLIGFSSEGGLTLADNEEVRLSGNNSGPEP
jgi:hypothetical protein